MSGVVPIGSTQEYSPKRREEELARMERMERLNKKETALPPKDETPLQVVRDDAQKRAENATLYNFRYTGTGSFIDKVF